MTHETTDLTAAIAREIYIAVERLTGDPELLSILGSYGDTLPDADILAILRDYNAGRPTLTPAETH